MRTFPLLLDVDGMWSESEDISETAGCLVQEKIARETMDERNEEIFPGLSICTMVV